MTKKVLVIMITFFCYIYKYGERRRLEFLQKLANEIDVKVPSDEKGIPSAQAQKVWLFPYKYDRVNDEISRLWSFFHKVVNDDIKDSDFTDILKIKGIGKTKLTEALFYIDPIKYLPINGPTKPYIKEELGINPSFKTYSEYVQILEKIKNSTDKPFYELSYVAWEWSEGIQSSSDSNEESFSNELFSFLEQAKTDNLKTKHYKNTFQNTDVKVSFGQGSSARIPWISFLKIPFTTSDGVYPVYLYFKSVDKLILAYGRSETKKPEIDWGLKNPKSIKEYFSENSLGAPSRYGDSNVFKVYDVNYLPDHKVLDNDLKKIIEEYSKIGLEIIEKEDQIRQEDLNISLFQQDCENSGLIYSEELITRYISSLVTKPFVLLSGLSGSGKTKLAQSFAQWICESKDQYCIVPVGADWTNREPLLGYMNALEPDQYILPENGALELIIKANEDSDRPYFLILDEMNLSHVERYFADFLSVMESDDRFKLHSSDDELETTSDIKVPSAISWPKNLFIVGTVNIDETTYMFSPKVLDRANVIEFRITPSDLNDYFESTTPFDMTKLCNGDSDQGLGASMGKDLVTKANDAARIDSSALDEELKNFFEKLQDVGAEFGYRTASEIQTLFAKIDSINPDFALEDLKPNTYKEKDDFKIDVAIMQKLLPKLHGSRNKLSDVLKTLATLCFEKGKLSGDEQKTIFELDNEDNLRFPISYGKLKRMHKNVVQNGFTSYAEA